MMPMMSMMINADHYCLPPVLSFTPQLRQYIANSDSTIYYTQAQRGKKPVARNHDPRHPSKSRTLIYDDGETAIVQAEIQHKTFKYY